MTIRSEPHIPATRWAADMYGAFAPTAYALKCWIKKGKIHPAPVKLDGKWFVVPSAEYRDSASDQKP